MQALGVSLPRHYIQLAYSPNQFSRLSFSCSHKLDLLLSWGLDFAKVEPTHQPGVIQNQEKKKYFEEFIWRVMLHTFTIPDKHTVCDLHQFCLMAVSCPSLMSLSRVPWLEAFWSRSVGTGFLLGTSCARETASVNLKVGSELNLG